LAKNKNRERWQKFGEKQEEEEEEEVVVLVFRRFHQFSPD